MGLWLWSFNCFQLPLLPCVAVTAPFLCPPSPEPVDRPPVLLIANSQNILATYLSGAPVPNITPTSAKQTTAMDFNYIEDTVCWVHVGDSASQTILKCAKIPNLKGFVEERSINISLSLHRELLPGLCGSSCAVFLLPAHLALAFPPSFPLAAAGESSGFSVQTHREEWPAPGTLLISPFPFGPVFLLPQSPP